MSTPDDPQNPYGTGGQPPQEPVDPATGPPQYPTQPPAASPYGSPTPYGSPAPTPYGSPAQYPGAPQYGAQYGAPQFGAPGYPTSPPPPNYLVWAILTTVLCCLPFGVVSIVFSSQVNTKWGQGDWAGAQASSKSAKTWAIVSASVGGGLILIWVVLAVIGAIAGDTTTY